MKTASKICFAALTGALLSTAALGATATPPAKAPAVPAKAAAAPAPQARVVIVDTPGLAVALKPAAGQPVVTEEVARKIGPIMYADNILTPNESNLINALMKNVDGKVQITVPAADGKPADHFELGVLSVGARNFLSLSNPPDLNTLWMQGYVPMKQLIDVTLLDPFAAGQVQRFISQQFYLALAASNMTNGYKPIRASVETALAQWKGAGPLTEPQAKKLAFGALTDVNAGAKGAVPADLLAELKP